MRIISLGVLTLLLFSCKTEGVEKENAEGFTQNVNANPLDAPQKVIDTKKLENGIVVSWIQHGKGEKLMPGDVVMIDYKVRLKDSTVIDGNHLLNMESFPFIVGFGRQPGWDIALKELRVGDFAYIKLPGAMARGSNGIDGLIPDNADNFLAIRILSKKKPTRMRDGNKVWIIEENKSNKLKFNETNSIVFHAIASSPSSPMYYNSFRTNIPFTLKLEDNGLVPGLKKALINAKKGDKLFITVPSSEAYGAKGYVDIVKPNEDLFFDVLVLDVLAK
jgi:FKBP-type peptidyl-prolyl cis-trans isomerase